MPDFTGTNFKGGSATGKSGAAVPVFNNWKDADTYLMSPIFQGRLTTDDREVITDYTGAGYRMGYNKPLKNLMYEGIPLPGGVKKNVAQLNKTLDKFPSYKGTVNRGVKMHGEKFNAFMKAFKPGSNVTIPEFLSTSTGSGFGGNVKIKIAASGKRGKPIFKLSLHPYEHEVLFKSGTKFKTVKVDQSGESAVIFLREL